MRRASDKSLRHKVHVVIASHGSRDATWSKSVRSLARQIGKNLTPLTVGAAFLSLSQPKLAEAVRPAVKIGATRIVVLPLFIAPGRHAKSDIPKQLRALRREFPRVRFAILPPVGNSLWFTRALGEYLVRLFNRAKAR